MIVDPLMPIVAENKIKMVLNKKKLAKSKNLINDGNASKTLLVAEKRLRQKKKRAKEVTKVLNPIPKPFPPPFPKRLKKAKQESIKSLYPC